MRSSWLSFTPFLLCLELQVHLCTVGNCCQGATLLFVLFVIIFQVCRYTICPCIVSLRENFSLSDGILTEVKFVSAVGNLSIFMSLRFGEIIAAYKYSGKMEYFTHLSCSWLLFLLTSATLS